MSKLTSLHSIFRKTSIYGAIIGFHEFTFPRSFRRWRCFKPRTTDLVVIEGHLISHVYMDEVLRSVVLPFYEKTSDSTRPRLTMPEHISLDSAKNNVVRIDWSVLSSDMSTISTCLWHFRTDNGINKPPASRCSIAGDINADSSAPNHQYSEYAKQVLVLICRWLVTLVADEGILILEMWCLRRSSGFHVTFKGIAFQILKTNMFFMCLREITL